MNVLDQKLHCSLTVKVFLAIILLGFVHGIIQLLPALFEMECFSDGGICCHLSRRQRRLYQTRHRQFCRTLFWGGVWAMTMLAAWGLLRTCRSMSLIPETGPRLVVCFRHLEPVDSYGVVGLLGYVKTSVGEASLVSRDQDLAELDRFLDDETINTWYAPHQTYQPGKRGRKPIPAASKLRVHLLFARKQLPSFNETCQQITRNTLYQAFCGVKSISAGTLSTFRNSLSFDDLMALMKLFIRKAETVGFFEQCADLYVQDSTDLESPCSWKVIDTIQRGSQEIKVYQDPSAQLGKRAHKKGKSTFFVGHRKHTLGVVHGTKVIPLLSVVLPADRPDQYVLLPLLHLAGMVGLNVRYVVADLAYLDQKRKQVALERYGVLVNTDKKVNTTLPEHTNSKTGTPQCFQGNDMIWDGFDASTGQHTYICPVECPHHTCHYAPLCPGERTIDADSYPIAFRTLPVHTKPVREMLKKRKAVEPMFRRERQHGALDNVTVMGKTNVHVFACIADICDLLKALAKLQQPMVTTNT
jgi:hypothetical protein